MRLIGIGVLVACLAAPAAAEDAFSPACDLPFVGIANHHPIDASCGDKGAAADQGQIGQNTTKNSFCRSGPPALVTMKSFVALQHKADALQVTGTPDDRSPLQSIYETSEHATIGEGSLVHFAGYIIDAHYSNVSNGESVNCKKHGRTNNDIHILLYTKPTVADDCRTITAEISPHWRPQDWETGVLNDLGRPVRMTGQLFFDGIHEPCRAGHPTSPPRASVWEIHPIYAIDVCSHTRLADCNADDDHAWTPLSDYVLTDEAAEPADEPQ